MPVPSFAWLQWVSKLVLQVVPPVTASVISAYLLSTYHVGSKEVPPAARAQLRGVRHLIIDALRYAPHPTHMNVDEALALASEVAPGQTWLTHLSHELMHAEVEPTLPPGVRIAYDGLKLCF